MPVSFPKHVIRKLVDNAGLLFRPGPTDRLSTEGRALERKRRAVLTIAFNFAARLTSFALIVLASRMALADIGPERFGIWMTIASFLILLNFLDFGIGNGLVAPVARSVANQDPILLARYVTLGMTATLIVGACGVLLLLASISFLPWHWAFKGMASANFQEAKHALVIFAVLVGVSLPLQTVHRVLTGMQRAYVSHGLSFVTSLSMCIFLIATEDRHYDIGQYVLITFGSAQIPGIMALLLLAKEGMLRPTVALRSTAKDYRSLFSVGGLFFALQVGALLGWGSDQVLMSALRGPSDTGIYAIAARIFMLVSIPLYIANAPLWASYAEALGNGDLDDVRRTLRFSLIGSLAASSCISAIVLIFGRDIWQIFSNNFLAYNGLLMTSFAVWTIIDCTANALAMFLNGAHILREQLFTVTIFVFLSIPLKSLVITQYDYSYIPIVTSIIYMVSLIFVYFLFLRREIHKTIDISTNG